MDPNAALKDIREIVAAFDKESCTQEDLETLAELVSNLDKWLSNGGFLPKPWQEEPPCIDCGSPFHHTGHSSCPEYQDCED